MMDKDKALPVLGHRGVPIVQEIFYDAAEAQRDADWGRMKALVEVAEKWIQPFCPLPTSWPSCRVCEQFISAGHNRTCPVPELKAAVAQLEEAKP